jgi:broad specificity phosphatase PhoE
VEVGDHDGVELLAVRHGQSTANAAFQRAEETGIIAPVGLGTRDADIPLSALGRRQAIQLGRALARQRTPDVVYCSPYLRARQTWQIAATSLPGIPVIVDERLRDREMGRWELLTPGLIRDRFPAQARRRDQLGDLRYRPPGGESLLDVAARLRDVRRELPDRGRVLVVAHDATVLMLRYLIESLSDSDLTSIPPVANASITRWSTDAHGTLRLADYSDTAHLDVDGTVQRSRNCAGNSGRISVSG